MTHPGWGDGWNGQPVPEAPQHPETVRRRRSSYVRARRRRVLKRVLIGCGLALLVVVGLGVWLVTDALRAADALEAARADVQELQEQVRAGDSEAADRTLVQLQAHSSTAARSTTGPVWTLAGSLPWAGPNVRAVQTVAGAVDDLAQSALPSLMQATTIVDPAALAPVGGRVNLAPLQEAAPAIVAADDSVQITAQQLEELDTSALIGMVAEPVDTLRDQVADVAVTTATAARAALLVPAMMGADGPRDYLVLVQNNAEQRATGGIPGSVMHLHADAGAVTVVEERSGGSLSGLSEPALPLTDAENALFGPLLGTDMRDVTFTPDFPRTGALAKAIWEQKVGGTIDGVLSMDPVALGLVLEATGPVTLSDGSSLSASDAAQRLLNQVYLEIEDPRQQDAYFSDTSRSVFAAVVGGQGDAPAVMDALAEAARQGRLMVWSADEDEQTQLAPTVLGGALRGVDGDSAVIGVYLNDGTQAKVGYYLDLTVDAEATTCRPDGSQIVDAVVTLTYDAPADAAALPSYLVGLDDIVPLGDIRTNVLIYAPAGGGIESVRVKPEPQGVNAQVHDDLGVAARTFTLKPGESGTLDLQIVTGRKQTGNVHIHTTPTARQKGDAIAGSACEK
ncbi:DUF4012 domain-containing protein [Cellulomonas sp. Root137]|uniref:DUF4012 domain-containing protein n=1 Tax=Cellulomonas sp. Root137 TaxID=1736459 RepID=UPI0006F58F93|nr:DUF4012 domain-containing protein [Cellulomonas sp. Root137]KQY42811.1 hypothetical protein ASD18_17630 [Cellulomonas sp. Root137]